MRHCIVSGMRLDEIKAQAGNDAVKVDVKLEPRAYCGLGLGRVQHWYSDVCCRHRGVMTANTSCRF